MNIIFSALLFLILVGAVLCTNFDFIHPAVIFSGLWFVSSCLYLFMAEQWRMPCDMKTVALVVPCNLLCVAVMIFSSKLSVKVGASSSGQTNVAGKLMRVFRITGRRKEKEKWKRRFLVVLLATFYAVSTYMMFTRISELASMVSQYTDSENELYMARIAEVNGHGYGRLYINLMRLNIALGIVLAKRAADMIYNREKGYALYLPFLLYAVFFSIIRGSRNDLMYILGAYMFIFIFYVYKHSSSRKKALKKAFRFLLIFAVGIVVMWGLSGIFFSRVGDSAVSSAIGYIGGPLAALNHLLQHSEIIDSAYFGQNTFNAVYQVLSGLEMLSFKPASVYLPYSGNFIFKTNVYSMYGRYFSDFGVLGCIILTSIFGCFYGFIYGVICRIRKEKIAHRLILIYAACMYGLLMSFFEDTFYRTLPNTIYILLFVLAVDYLLFSGGHRLSLSWNRNH